MFLFIYFENSFIPFPYLFFLINKLYQLRHVICYISLQTIHKSKHVKFYFSQATYAYAAQVGAFWSRTRLTEQTLSETCSMTQGKKPVAHLTPVLKAFTQVLRLFIAKIIFAHQLMARPLCYALFKRQQGSTSLPLAQRTTRTNKEINALNIVFPPVHSSYEFCPIYRNILLLLGISNFIKVN